MQDTRTKDLERLNTFLREELLAVESYDRALERLAGEPQLAASLQTCRTSHLRRAVLLDGEVRRLGGEPARVGASSVASQGPGPLDGRSALVELERREIHARHGYQGDLAELSPGVRGFVQSQLALEQRRSHYALCSLRSMV